MGNTKIEWAEKVWNPVTGCSKISPGCENCYAERMAFRLRGRCGYPADDPFRVTLHPERLDEPLKWKKPRKVFVCSMGDLFHEDVPDEFIYEIWDVMVQSKQHTFLVLTKRPDRMKSFIEKVMCNRMDYALTFGGTPEGKEARKWAQRPIQNIWLGVTAENQEQADKRIPILLQIPAAVRFVSVEPMLGPVDLTRVGGDWHGHGRIDALNGRRNIEEYIFEYSLRWKTERCEKIDWVICGGETGPGARPMHPEWVRSLKDQCQEAGVPFFFKQWGEWFPRDQWEWNPELILPDDEYAYRDGSGTHVFEDIDGLYPVHRVGKKAAGRLLDGRTWDEMPEI